MVFSHLESDSDLLHVNYYEPDSKREGIIEFNLANPTDLLRIQPNDTLDIDDVHAFVPGKPCIITLHHADNSIEKLQARCTGST